MPENKVSDLRRYRKTHLNVVIQNNVNNRTADFAAEVSIKIGQVSEALDYAGIIGRSQMPFHLEKSDICSEEK